MAGNLEGVIFLIGLGRFYRSMAHQFTENWLSCFARGRITC
jgi:hypothetical protein